MIRDNLQDVMTRVRTVTESNGIGQSVTLVAVTKNQPISVIPELEALGVANFAENRVQDLIERAELMCGTRHLIGHLQTNKVRKVIPYADLIQSVDSLHLAQEIQRCAALIGKVQDVLIQVNVAKEPQKYGVAEEELRELLIAAGQMSALRVRGLMAIMPIETTDAYYRKMYELFRYYKDSPVENCSMEILSMGMSNDFETAVRYGSNMIRVGRRLYL